MRMTVAACAAALALAVPAAAQPALPAGVKDSSFVEPNGDRVLQISTVVRAPAVGVW